MSFDRFTEPLCIGFRKASQIAGAAGASRIGADHLLAALVRDRRCVAARLLGSLGAPVARLRLRIPSCSETPPRDGMHFSEGAQRALGLALEIAQRLGHDHIGTGHVLLGLAACGDPAVDPLRSLIPNPADQERPLAEIVAARTRFPHEHRPFWHWVTRKA